MAKFEIGEVAILVGQYSNFTEDTAMYAGAEVEIVDPCENRFGYPVPEYGVRCRDGVELWTTEKDLRKKHPPSTDIAETKEKGAPSFDDMITELNAWELIK